MKIFKGIVLLYFLFGLQNLTIAQRISFGVSFDMFSFHVTHFKEDVVFSNGTYKAFYINKTQTNFSPLIGTSVITMLDYSHFSLTIETGIQNDPNGPVVSLKYPVINEQFTNYYSRVSNGGFQINSIFNYSFSSSKYMKPFVGIGFANLWPIQVKEDFTTYKDFSKAWFDEYEFKPDYKLDKPYLRYLVAFGYKNSDFNFCVKYNFKWNNDVTNENFYSYFVLSASIYSSFMNLKKHYLYFD